MNKRAIIKRNLYIFLLLSCIIFNEIGCVKRIKESDQTSELKAPIEDKILIAKILAKTSERRNSFKDLRAVADITVQYPQKKIKRKNIVLLRNDPAARFEALSISGRPLMYLTADSINTSVYYPDRNIIYKGASSTQNISRILGINMDLNDIVTILSGNFNIPSQFQKIELNESKGFYLINFILKNNEVTQVFLDKKNYLPSKIEYNNEGGDLITVQYSSFKQINNYHLPFVIKIKDIKKNLKIFVKYKKALSNQGISDSSFTIPIYKGVKILPLENR